MSLTKALLCIFLPPVAVMDKGCGTTLLVGVLWLCAWIPGSIAAWIICSKDDSPKVVEVHHYHDPNTKP
jgi:uncharacterized membrane protein YqaE (UPF0057 family)